MAAVRSIQLMPTLTFLIGCCLLNVPSAFIQPSKSSLSHIENHFGLENTSEPCPQCHVELALGRLEKASDRLERPISVLIEDRYSPGTFYYLQRYHIMKFRPGYSAERFLGKEKSPKFTPGSSTTARFRLMVDMIQYNETKILISEIIDTCIVEYDIEEDYVSAAIGHCGSAGDMKISKGESRNNSFSFAAFSMTLLRSRDQLVSCDLSGLILLYDFKTKTHRRLADNLHSQIPRPQYILANVKETEIFVSHTQGISKVNLETLQVTALLYNNQRANIAYPPFIAGSFSEGQIGRVLRLEWAVKDRLFVSVSDRSSEALIFVDLIGQEMFAVCTGSNTTNVTVTGPLDMCELNAPTALAVAEEGAIYVVTLEDGAELVNFTSRGVGSFIYKIKTHTSPVCDIPEHTGDELLTLSHEILFPNETITVTCPKGQGLDSNSKVIRCAENATWDRPVPQCVDIISTDGLKGISPTFGQLAGGTKVTLTGLVPDVGGQIYVNHSSSSLMEVPFTITTIGQQMTFRMPSQAFVGPAEIFIRLTENITVNYTYLYLENPKVNYTMHSSTILSGGISVVFGVDNLNSSSDYILNVGDESYRMSCKKGEREVSCLTEAFPDSFSVDNVVSLRMELLADGILVASSDSLPPLTLYSDPKFNSMAITVEYGAPLDLEGDQLDVGSLNGEYVVFFPLSDMERIECVVLKVSESLLRCQPNLTNHQPGADPLKVTIMLGNLNTSPATVFFQPLMVTSENTDLILSTGEISGVIAAVVITLIVTAIIIVVFCKRHRDTVNELADMTLTSIKLSKRVDWLEHINQEIKSKIEPLIIRPNTLKLLQADPIGRGNFGKIFLGKLYYGGEAETVAVKTIKEMDPEISTIEQFLSEAVLLMEVTHPYVLSTLGVYIPEEKKPPQVILPYMKNGDLKSLIHNASMNFTIGDLMHFAKQIACGMEYLSSRRYLHRDLAARNCLVNEKFIVKIADFGLSRDIYTKNYYRREEGSSVALPIKWLSLESLRPEAKFTSKSDVWSYGVLVWELLTRGSEPYQEVSTWDMRAYLEAERRLPKPHFCSNTIFEFISMCWLENPDERPTFSEIHEFLENLLEGTKFSSQTNDYVRQYTKDVPRYTNDLTGSKVIQTTEIEPEKSLEQIKEPLKAEQIHSRVKRSLRQLQGFGLFKDCYRVCEMKCPRRPWPGTPLFNRRRG